LAEGHPGKLSREGWSIEVKGFCPYQWGYKSAKSVVKVEVTDDCISGFWKQQGYLDEALIRAGKVCDMNQGGQLRPISDGEVIRFLDD